MLPQIVAVNLLLTKINPCLEYRIVTKILTPPDVFAEEVSRNLKINRWYAFVSF